MRTRHPAPVDALALVTTGGRADAEQLLSAVLGTEPGWEQLVRRRKALLFLASAWAVTPGSTDHVRAAALLFEHLWQHGRRPAFRAEHHVQAAQAMLLSGRHESLDRLLPELTLPEAVRQALHTDLVNPWLPASADAADLQEWASRFGQPFVNEGHVAPGVGEENGDLPFDRLQAPGPRPGSAGGDLVTVVMPCYRPDRGLLSSVRSIVAQTWADLEILLVDDASGPEFDDLFETAASFDERIRRITLERNGGSYLAREAAIAQARGRYVTFQDADDWSHPSRIEQQVAVLRGRAEGASRSMALRAHDDLSLQWIGYSPVRPNASSLMLSTGVLERCGGFVPIRKGADSELAERVVRLGVPVIDTGTLLAITRLRQGSLSRADFTYSWMAPDRVTFRSAFRAWHRTLDPGGTDPAAVGTEALHRMPFPVPRTFLRGLPGLESAPEQLPTAFLGDFSHPDAPSNRWLLSEGLESAPGMVGLWHQEAPTAPRIARSMMADAWSDRIQASGRLRPLSRVEDVTVDRLVVLDPLVLALTSAQECRVRAGAVEMCLTPELVEPDRSFLPADLLGLADQVRRWTGARPVWVAAPWLDASEVELVDAAVPGLLRP